MRKLIVFNSKKCTGCRTCEMICSLRASGTCNPAASKVLIAHEHKEAAIARLACHFCQKPPCIQACPVDALRQDEATGVINVDQGLCFGCLRCVEECPFGGIRLDVNTGQMLVCDLCGGEPACVQFCDTGALVLARRDGIGVAKQLARAASKGVK